MSRSGKLNINQKGCISPYAKEPIENTCPREPSSRHIQTIPIRLLVSSEGRPVGPIALSVQLEGCQRGACEDGSQRIQTGN